MMSLKMEQRMGSLVLAAALFVSTGFVETTPAYAKTPKRSRRY